MRCIITIALVLALTVTPCHGLTLFQTDYDGDSYTTETVYEGDWLPLRKLSEVLPYEVEWNEQERTVYIYAERTHTIRPDWWLPPDVQIVEGATYVTARYLDGILGGRAFRYQGELYVFTGETEHSRLVRGGETFRANTLTTLYRLKLALPEDYKLIRRYLKGGIEAKPAAPGGLVAAAYTYPTASRPTAYIVASGRTGANLAELIAHEAYHAAGKGEKQTADYGRRVKQDLLENTQQRRCPDGNRDRAPLDRS